MAQGPGALEANAQSGPRPVCRHMPAVHELMHWHRQVNSIANVQINSTLNTYMYHLSHMHCSHPKQDLIFIVAVTAARGFGPRLSCCLLSFLFRFAIGCCLATVVTHIISRSICMGLSAALHI